MVTLQVDFSTQIHNAGHVWWLWQAGRASLAKLCVCSKPDTFWIHWAFTLCPECLLCTWLVNPGCHACTQYSFMVGFGHLASSSSYCLCSVVQQKCPSPLFAVGPVETAPCWTRHCVWDWSGTWHLHRKLADCHTGRVTESHSSRKLNVAVDSRIHPHVLMSDCVLSICFFTTLWNTFSLWYNSVLPWCVPCFIS